MPITIIPLLISPTRSLPVAYFSLLLGCCVAIALHALRGKQEEVLSFINRIPTTVAVIVWILSYVASLGGTFRVSFILTTAALLPVLLLRESLFSRILGSRICSYVGKRTYSMYLFHAFCLTLFEDKVIHPTTGARYLGVVVLTYLLSLGVASVVYVVLEGPAVSRGRSLARAYTRGLQRRARKKSQETAHDSPDLTNTTIIFTGLDHAETKAFVTVSAGGC